MFDPNEIAELKWFHSIDFGTLASSGRFPKGSPQNITLYGAFELLKALDLRDASVLDLGTYDGLAAFGMRGLGAREVFAVDTGEHKTFRLARRILGLEDQVQYRPGHQIRALHEVFEPKSLDCILCAGIFYHMLYPMQAFVEPRKLLRDGGYLVMETPFEDGRDEALLLFNGETATVNEPFTYFVPTRAALCGMARLAGFQLIAERVLHAPRRITLLLKAVGRDVLIDDPATAPMTVQMLKRDTCDDEFRFKVLEALPPAPARISLTRGLAPTRTIVAATEVVDWPYHPPRDRPTAGTTRFETARGNTLTL